MHEPLSPAAARYAGIISETIYEEAFGSDAQRCTILRSFSIDTWIVSKNPEVEEGKQE